MTTQALEYIEIDVPWCQLLYGLMNSSGLCPAVLGVDSQIKCFQTLPTCPVPDSFTPATVTLRFVRPTDYLPDDIDAIPSIHDVDFTPAKVSLGEDLGTRATLEVIFDDHPWSDTGEGFDKYVAERPYNPYDQGTFWGKFRARFVSLRGQPIRWIQGLVGQSLEEMTTRHYVIDSIDGPRADGTFSIIAKDVIKLLDRERAQAPGLSEGFATSAISDTDTSVTMSPTGIGDEGYPSEGFVNFGGKEICGFTRAGDDLTLTRAQRNTEAVAHEQGERLQLCLVYEPQNVADIVDDLEINHVPGFDPDWIDLDNWRSETDGFLAVPYSGFVAEPTAVSDLVAELVQQAALATWWDDSARLQRLLVLRGVSTGADLFGEDDILRDSLDARDQPETRVSEVWIYIGQINPLKNLDQIDNWSETVKVKGDAGETSEKTYGSPAIKKIFARWIPAGGRVIAQRLGELILSRFGAPPRRFRFGLQRHYGIDTINLGGGYRLQHRIFQEASGATERVPIQATRLTPGLGRLDVEAEEMLATPTPAIEPGTVIFTFDQLNIDARAEHDGIWGAPTDPGGGQKYKATFIIEDGATIGSERGNDTPASFDLGDWADVIAFTDITVINRGLIAGNGGNARTPFSLGDGFPGGDAIATDVAIDLDNTLGDIRAGGGSGGSGGRTSEVRSGAGGGGAGVLGGSGANGLNQGGRSEDGTATSGGSGQGGQEGHDGGDGGGPGRSGQSGEEGGGAAGFALTDGGLVTFINDGITRDHDEFADGGGNRVGSASGNFAEDADLVRTSAYLQYGGGERVLDSRLRRSASIVALFSDATAGFVDSDVETADQSSYSISLAIGAAAGDRKVTVCIEALSSSQIEATGVTIGGVPVTDLSVQRSEEGTDGWSFVGIFSAAVPSGTTAQIDVDFSGTATSCAMQTYHRVGAGGVDPVGTDDAGSVNPMVLRVSDVSAGSCAVAAAIGTVSSGVNSLVWSEGRVLGRIG